VTATQAAAELRVTPATLYAYVSRGLLHSEPVAPEVRVCPFCGSSQILSVCGSPEVAVKRVEGRPCYPDASAFGLCSLARVR